jgi:predicted transcriptional regulator
MEPTATKTVLDRMLDPLGECFDTEVAERVVALRIDDSIQARIDVLADRSSEGLLTDSERAEYESSVEGAEFLSLIKLEARRYLLAHGGN